MSPLRIFVSHTSELRDFPKGRSYLSEVERAISAVGHVIVDMADFPAVDQRPAHLCEERVRSCDVYIGVLGTRYGSPVREKPQVSYTELEFDTATAAGLDRLVFMLDPDAENVNIPPKHLMDREFGDRQDAFRRRVREMGLTTQSFAEPVRLGQLVERSLRELADTRQRISSGIQREQVPAEPQPVRASKFVNPPPATAPSWFQGRQAETERLAAYVTDPGIRMVTVVGRGGIGKTAMVCRLLKGLEAGRIPGLQRRVPVAGIVYLSNNGVHPVDYSSLIEDMLRLLPADVSERLHRRYRDPHHTPRNLMLSLLEAFPVGDPVVILLDNLESVMDAEHEALTEPALLEALTVLLTGPAHAVTLIATTRVTPTQLLRLEPAGQRQLRLDAGLGSPEAENVLRSLDEDGHLGLRDAPDVILDGLRRHTRGFPRALEAIKAILEGDGTLTPHDLLNRTDLLTEDQVVQVLVGEAYELLDTAAQRVMQALAVYPAPVSTVAVDFLLRPADPTIDAAPILARLVRRRLVRFEEGQYHLHPVDRDYASSQITADGTESTLSGLRERAADYYTLVRSPRDSWRGLDDVRPQLAEFELRCDAGDYDTAAKVLADIDEGYLQVWGHCRLLVDLHARVHGRTTESRITRIQTAALGMSHFHLGNYEKSIELHTRVLAIDRACGDRAGEAAGLSCIAINQDRLGNHSSALDLLAQALVIDRDRRDRRGEAMTLLNIGALRYKLGDYAQALDLFTQVLVMSQELRARKTEASALDNLGLVHYRLGDYRQGIESCAKSIAMSQELGYRRGESYGLGNLGLIHHQVGEYSTAIELNGRAIAIAREIGDPYGEANAVSYLGWTWYVSGNSGRATELLEESIRIADGHNDVEPAVEARSWLARIRLYQEEPEAALALTSAARELPYPPEQATLRLLEGIAFLQLRDYDRAVSAFAEAIRDAGDLLAMADRNVTALQVRLLALCGTAASTGGSRPAAQAMDALARAGSAVSAPGVLADTKDLLTRLVALDPAGTLAGVTARF